MSFRDELISLTPRLRRYARALVSAHPAPNDLADELVRAALQNMLDSGIPGRWFDLEIRAYSALTQLHREAWKGAGLDARAALERGHSCAGGLHAAKRTEGSAAPRDRLSSALGTLGLEEREALLLVVLEGFDYARAARILKMSRAVLIARLSRARDTLGRALNSEGPANTSKSRAPHLRLVK